MNTDFKIRVYNACLATINQKIERLENQAREMGEDGRNDAKSSAGDKHETLQAMMQLEMDKILRPLKELNEQKQILEKINPEKPSEEISLGSVIETDKGYFFLSVGAGKFFAENMEVFALSPQSPLGKLLTGKSKDETVEINGNRFLIREVL